MKHRVASQDSIHLDEGVYLVARQKGHSMPYTMLLHRPEGDYDAVAALPGKTQSLFYYIAKRLSFNGVSKVTFEEIMRFAKVSNTQMFTMLGRLREDGLIKRVGKDTYKLNPEYVWRGSQKERLRAVEEWKMMT